MTEISLLPLSVALTKLDVTKVQLQAAAKLSDEELAGVAKHGANLDQAEIIALAYGMHPSEIWGDTWVDAVLTFSDWPEL
jgi:hypothetical protein